METSGIYDNQKRRPVSEFLRDRITPDGERSIVSAYFTIYADEALKNTLDGIKDLRYLFGEPRSILDPAREDYNAFNAEDLELRLDRITTDSSGLLAIIKREGKV